MAAPSLVFWDWNGTLMDDAAYSCGCLNGLLDEYGYPQRYDLDAYRSVFGFPSRTITAGWGSTLGATPSPFWPRAICSATTPGWTPAP